MTSAERLMQKIHECRAQAREYARHLEYRHPYDPTKTIARIERKDGGASYLHILESTGLDSKELAKLIAWNNTMMSDETPHHKGVRRDEEGRGGDT
ncbi:MAG: hypothetical protein GY906_38990 [bacterium]|nr:hypothetical protein [bacterium]